MKSFIYGFDKLDPDSGDRAESGAGFVINMNSVSGMYVPGPSAISIRKLIDEEADQVFGDIAAIHSHDTFMLTSMSSIPWRKGGATKKQQLYIGDLYGKEQSPVEYIVTPSDQNFSTTAETTASFCSFGNTVYYASLLNPIVSLNIDDFKLGTQTEFNFISTTPAAATVPKAKYICGHGGHLVAANIKFSEAWGGYLINSEHPQMVWWSGFDFPGAFGSFAVTPELKGSDYKFLYDTQGEITGMVSTGDHLLIFKSTSIYIAEGPPFRFKLLASNIGTICPNSITYHNGWVYFMSLNGPARVRIDGQYEYLLDGKAKATLNIDGTTLDMSVENSLGVISFNSCMMYPFSFNGIYVNGTNGNNMVYTALSEQYNIVYFSYPANWSIWHADNTTWGFTGMVTMSYDMTSGNVGFSYIWPSNQEYAPSMGFGDPSPLIPWDEATLHYDHESGEASPPRWSLGTKNIFAMKTMAYKPSKGKSKDVIVIGTRISSWRSSLQIVTPPYAPTECTDLPLEYYYLDPTIFYGRNISHYTRSCIGTKILRPSTSKSKITKIRPIIRFGHNSSKFQPVCQIASWSDSSISGVEVYGHEPFVEFGPYRESDLNLIHTDESTFLSSDGSIIFNNTVFADEHMIIFSFHTESSGGVTALPDFVTTTGIIGLEIFFVEQGEVSR